MSGSLATGIAHEPPLLLLSILRRHWGSCSDIGCRESHDITADFARWRKVGISQRNLRPTVGDICRVFNLHVAIRRHDARHGGCQCDRPWFADLQYNVEHDAKHFGEP